MESNCIYCICHYLLYFESMKRRRCFWSRWVKKKSSPETIYLFSPLALFILCNWCEAECETRVFLCVSQGSTFEYVLRETRVAPRRWKTNLASGANRTSRIWRTKQVTSCEVPSCPDIKGSTVSISLISATLTQWLTSHWTGRSL